MPDGPPSPVLPRSGNALKAMSAKNRGHAAKGAPCHELSFASEPFFSGEGTLFGSKAVLWDQNGNPRGQDGKTGVHPQHGCRLTLSAIIDASTSSLPPDASDPDEVMAAVPWSGDFSYSAKDKIAARNPEPSLGSACLNSSHNPYFYDRTLSAQSGDFNGCPCRKGV